MADEATAKGTVDRFLSGVELFSELDDDELRQLAVSFKERKYAKDAIVFHHGDDAAALYVVRAGAVALFRDQVGRPLQLLGRYAQGDHFGELGLFDGDERQATARVTEACRLLELSRHQLLEFLSDHPNLALRLHMSAARRHTENVAAVLGIGPRDEVRIRVDRPLRMRTADGSASYVVLENLSKGGLSLRGAPTEWQPSARVRFTLEIDDKRLEVRGRVAWRGGDTLGVAFETKSPERDEQIQRALHWLIHHDTVVAATKGI